ncbi:MAG TPA: Rad52/Rad22 family DNA repair protein [Ktedonobacterales bacterium]|nr:Rad52/Rad22 family DNA repair protein [Ktedonobacterales bacterium]
MADVDSFQQISREQWDEIARQLREPFDPKDVDFRVQGRANEQTGRAQAVAYIDARAVQDRLDVVVGAGNWSFDWQPLVIDKGEVMVAKGTVTIFGVAKSDAGSASNFEQSLGAVSHCFKRAAVHWGVGRYLYNLPMAWVSVEKGGRIPEPVLRELRAKLPRPNGRGVAQTMEERTHMADASDEQRNTTQRVRPLSSAAATSEAAAPQTAPASIQGVSEPEATEKQLASIRKLCEVLGKPEPATTMSYSQARELITQLSGEFQRMRRAS